MSKQLELFESEYYYLDDITSNPKKHIKTKTLKDDIKRGVKHLNVWSYAENWGATRTDIRFLNALKKHIDLQTVYRAELKYSIRQHWRLFLYTNDGYTLIFKGVSGGYSGEGTRGCHDILKACGFNKRQCRKVWSNVTFKVIKNKMN